MEELLHDTPEGSKIVLKGCHPLGIELMTIGYNYCKKMYFILYAHPMLVQLQMESHMK